MSNWDDVQRVSDMLTKRGAQQHSRSFLICSDRDFDALSSLSHSLAAAIRAFPYPADGPSPSSYHSPLSSFSCSKQEFVISRRRVQKSCKLHGPLRASLAPSLQHWLPPSLSCPLLPSDDSLSPLFICPFLVTRITE